MSSLLEDRYRRVLRLLPTPYRLAWEEDMVATFLQAAYAADPDDPEGVELGRPDAAEMSSVAALAVRLRLGGPGAAPRYQLWGDAVRRLALVGLLANAVLAIVGVILEVWITLRLPGISVPADAVLGYPTRWHALWGLTALLWLPAYLSVVYGHFGTARVLAAAAFAPRLITVSIALASDAGAFTASATYSLLFEAIGVLALAAFHNGAPQVNTKPWLIALPAGVVGIFALLLLSQPPTDHYVLLDLPALWCLGVTAAAVAHLIMAARGPGQRAPAWSLALAVLAAAALGLRIVTLVDLLAFFPAPNRSTMIVVSVAEAAAVFVVALWLGVLTRRAVRALPPG